MANLYTQTAVDNLINRFSECENFELYTIPGSLLDNHIITAKGKKTAIIREKYLNEWSSAYTIILYNKTPKKYQNIIDLLNNDNEKEAAKLFFK